MLDKGVIGGEVVFRVVKITLRVKDLRKLSLSKA